MLFNSIDFLLFFPIVTMVYFVLPVKIRNMFLLGAGFYFYMQWRAYYIVLILFCIATTYVGGILIEKSSENSRLKRLLLALCILANLSILFLFKYYNFFIDNLGAVTGLALPILTFALPVGISFYTFQAIAYVADVYSGTTKAEKNPINYALFISFYPQLVAGPIERSSNLLKQVNSPKRFSEANMRRGILLMGYGYFLKLVIADRLAIFVNSVYSDYMSTDGIFLVLATVMFAIQIYCDFASYSYIAIGAARVMGYELMTNFKAPYLSKNLSEYWSRWHISLSTWFEDYVFNPIVYSSKKPKIAVYFAVAVVFALSGLWHGAGTTFVVWGLLHALYRIVGIALRSPKKRLYKNLGINTKKGVLPILQTIVTFALVSFSYIFFRAQSMQQATTIISRIMHSTDITSLFSPAFFNYGIDIPDLVISIASLLLLLVCDNLIYRGVDVYGFIVARPLLLRWTFYLAMIFVITVFGIYGPNYDTTPFIYFQF